jgi:hypothetical protein
MADDELKVTEIPMQLQPQMWETVPEDFHADPVVSVLRDAHATAKASWTATLTGHRRIMVDPLHTETMNLKRSADAAGRRQDEALRRLDGAVERARREITFIDDAMAQPQDPPAPHVVTLIANRLSNMRSEDRSKILSDALANDDRATLGAALFSGPAWVYGMSQPERDMLLHSYRQARFPQALARKAALEQAISVVTNAGQALIQANGKLIDRKRLDDAVMLAKAAEAALGD